MINWKLRLKNKATVSALVGAAVLFAYQVCAALGIEVPVQQDALMSAVGAVLTVLCALGILVDPTTEGIADSERAMGYDELGGGTDGE